MPLRANIYAELNATRLRLQFAPDGARDRAELFHQRRELGQGQRLPHDPERLFIQRSRVEENSTALDPGDDGWLADP